MLGSVTMTRALLFVALLPFVATLGGCSALSQPEELRVVKDVPVPPRPQPAAAGPGAAKGRSGAAAALAELQKPGRKKGGG